MLDRAPAYGQAVLPPVPEPVQVIVHQLVIRMTLRDLDFSQGDRCLPPPKPGLAEKPLELVAVVFIGIGKSDDGNVVLWTILRAMPGLERKRKMPAQVVPVHNQHV